jgi:DNA polymerase III subunit delta'
MISIAAFESWPIQTDVLERLHRTIESGRIPHAMLFVGKPEDTEALTEYLVRLLLCTAPGAPCGRCASCLQMDNHPDAIRVMPGDNGSVKTSQIEEVQERLSRKSHTGGRLVYTVPGVDNMTVVAANRLLKTLEEPNPSVFALLSASNLQKVLPTIVSRCFVYPVQSAGNVQPWEDILPDIQTTDAQVSDDGWFAATSKAVVQWAETLLVRKEEPLLLADALVQAAGDVGVDAFLWLLAVYFRDLAHVKAGEREFVKFAQHLSDLERQSQVIPIQRLFSAAQVVIEARTRMKAHVAVHLNLEQMCIRLREVLTSV